jgi:hypothetical protein
MIKNDIIDYDESIKREYESDYFNDKFFEIFPTKYEKMLREYEVIYFKDEVRISFFNLDFSDDLIWYEECDFIDRVRHSLYSISELINSQKTEKLKKFWNIFEEIYWEIVQEKIPKDNKKVLNFMNELKMEINEILKTFPLEKVEEYREIIKEYAGKFWNRIEKSKTKSKRLYYEKALLFILVKLENLLNIQHEEQFLQNYVCILNDLYSDDFNDNGSFSNLFFLNKVDKGVYFSDDTKLFSFELVKIANSFDEFMDNIENFDLSNYSRYFVSIK